MKKLLAELIGTATLVLFGCGAAVLGDFGQTGIATAFGLAIVAMFYGIGPISGCHINPAVSLGAFVSGRMKSDEMLKYWAAQFVGATVGAGIVYMIASGKLDGSGAGSMGTNGWGIGYLGEYSLMSALIFELFATFVFVIVVLGATQKKTPAAMAGLAIGLTLWGIHLVGIQVSGVSVNPARSFGPALFHTEALGQLWMFFVAPFIGAAAAGLVFKYGYLEISDDT